MTWQPIETAPKNGRIILLHDGEYYDRRLAEEVWGYPFAIHVGWWGDRGFNGRSGEFGWCVSYEDETGSLWETIRPDLWQHLPEPPQ